MEMEVWMEKWTEIVAKWNQLGYESLTEDERVWFNIRSLIDTVDDGGIISFYYNSGADYMEETIEDLKKLGFSKVVKYLEKINKLFPDKETLKDMEERNKIIESWDKEGRDYSELFSNIDEKFYDVEDKLESIIEPVIIRVMKG